MYLKANFISINFNLVNKKRLKRGHNTKVQVSDLFLLITKLHARTHTIYYKLRTLYSQ